MNVNIAAEVESSNTVGYMKLGLVNGLNLVSVPFVATGTGSGIDINAALSSADMTTGTAAMFWDAVNKRYETISYYDEGSDGGIFTDDSYSTCLGPGWGDGNQISIPFPITQGEGFWIQSAGVSTNNFSGQVSTNTVPLSLVMGLNLVGNPFPATLPIQNIKGAALETGTAAMFWDAANKRYETVSYYDEGSDGGIFTDDSYSTCLGPGWGDGNQIAVDTEIDPLAGFWIQSASAANITIEY